MDSFELAEHVFSDNAGAAPPIREGVNRPEHYVQRGGIEPIYFINSNDLNFNLGNIVKYAYRAGLKDGESPEKDLAKIIQYAQFELERLREKEAGNHA